MVFVLTLTKSFYPKKIAIEILHDHQRTYILDKYQLIGVPWVAPDATIRDTDVTKFDFYLPKKNEMETAFQNESVIYSQTMVQLP